MNTLYKYLNDILIAHRETFESLFDSEDALQNAPIPYELR